MEGEKKMIFEYASFIKPNVPFKRGFSYEDYAPMFRKKFTLNHFSEAKVYVCGLGYGYYYINGKKITEDLFTAPVSDYRKTLWYNEYDVSKFLQEGENVVAVICGNGWYNESIETKHFENAPWKDLPKFILKLEVDGKTELVTDSTWKCKPESAVIFNQLRSGEYFDFRKYDPEWVSLDFDDSTWEKALRDPIPPTGKFRLCNCQPIRVCREYPAVRNWKIDDHKYIFDIGQNIAGFIKLTAIGEEGDELIIRYAERIDETNNLNYYDMDNFLKSCLFQTDKVILNGKEIVWSPMFVYHGFRYIEISGIRDVSKVRVSGLFVHQDVKRRTEFSCSDPFLTRMFRAGIMSSWSNMYYMMTDCPTREKLGWANDAQASAEQLMIDFEIEGLFTKWIQDIRDAQLPDGALPGIIPTSGWGYHWGNGPVSDGVLFEIPYRIYLHTGNSRLLTENLDAFDRYLKYLERQKNEEGLIAFGLNDWASPRWIYVVENTFINAILIYEFYRIAALAAKLLKEQCVDNSYNGPYQEQYYLEQARKAKEFAMEKFIDQNGRCTVNEQCAVAMLIYYDFYQELKPLKNQLIELLEANDFHLKCGMVGLRRLFLALNKCGHPEYAYKVLHAEGYPGFKTWFEHGETTLSEKWENRIYSDSENHHMYSDFMSWIMKTLVGISLDERKPGSLEFIWDPKCIPQIDWVKCSYQTENGKIDIEWHREGEKVIANITKEPSVILRYKNMNLKENNIIEL